MHVIGFIAAALIGISLGLIGSGGSILTVPVLVYLFSVSPSLATSYSLFIVGITSLVGAYKNYRKGLVHFRTALIFSASSVTTVFLIRKFIIPQLPKVFFSIGTFQVTEPFAIMIVFAFIMFAVSISMLTNKPITYSDKKEHSIFLVLIYGITIGIITGFLGVGGGSKGEGETTHTGNQERFAIRCFHIRFFLFCFSVSGGLSAHTDRTPAPRKTREEKSVRSAGFSGGAV